MKKVNFLNPIRKGIHLSLLLLFSLIVQESQSQSWAGTFIRINETGQISFASNTTLSVDAPNITAGRFVIWENGNIGIFKGGNRADTKARFHLNGNAIIQDQTLIGTGASVDKWLVLTTTSKANWGLWVDKGVVATNYAITTPDKWADYVFDSTYKLRPLSEVEQFIKANKHLPEIPSQQKIKDEGYTVHDMNTCFMQKIEELTLYTIEQDKQIKTQQQQIEKLTSRLEKIETTLTSSSRKKIK